MTEEKKGTFIETWTEGKTGFLKFSNPKKKNALSMELCEDLISSLKEFEKKGILLAILRAGKNDSVWSSGLDITEFEKCLAIRQNSLPAETEAAQDKNINLGISKHGYKRDGTTIEQSKCGSHISKKNLAASNLNEASGIIAMQLYDPLDAGQPLPRLLAAIENYPGIVAAEIHGSAWGGAAELVAACDLAAADNTASFAITPAKIGLPYSEKGLLRFISRIGLPMAKRLFYTASQISAKEAKEAGFIHWLTDSDSFDELDSLVREQILPIANLSPVIIKTLKKQFRLLSSAPLPKSINREFELLRAKAFASGEFQKGIEAFLNRHKKRIDKPSA